jgi:aldose 1-epimerase
MVSPSGEQFELRAAGYRAVVTEVGATLRVLEYDGRPLVDGFADHAYCHGGRGQLLVPWPGRIQDGSYSFEGRACQLPLSEPARHNASHGLVRWVSWSVEEHTAHSVSLVYRLAAQPGYPWSLDLHVSYDLSADGLTVTQTATNLADSPAPYACGAHPYLSVGEGPIDTWELTLPASRRTLVDDRLLPVGSQPVDDTDYDFRIARPIKDTVFDDAFTELERDEYGHAAVVLEGDRDGLTLWVDEHVRWLQIFSADAPEYGGRRSIAIEPMTAQGNAFRTGEDLVTLAPSGEPGDDLSVSWGIRVN